MLSEGKCLRMLYCWVIRQEEEQETVIWWPGLGLCMCAHWMATSNAWQALVHNARNILGAHKQSGKVISPAVLHISSQKHSAHPWQMINVTFYPVRNNHHIICGCHFLFLVMCCGYVPRAWTLHSSFVCLTANTFTASVAQSPNNALHKHHFLK